MKKEIDLGKYLIFKDKKPMMDFIGYVVWVSLAVFVVDAKKAMGHDAMIHLEVIMYIVGIASTFWAYGKYANLRISIILNIIIENIFLILLYINVVYYQNHAVTGYLIYFVIMLKMSGEYTFQEKSRDFEDHRLKEAHNKDELRKMRRKNKISTLLGAALGAGATLFFVDTLEIDTYTYASYLLILNFVQNLGDYYLWFKYIK